MAWTAITAEELVALIADGVAAMEPSQRIIWDLVRVPPMKWQLTPWGNDGGGFWVVGLIGKQVVWYNDIECGFNISPYETTGIIADYRCNHDDLNHTIYGLQNQLQTGVAPGWLGAPQTLL